MTLSQCCKARLTNTSVLYVSGKQIPTKQQCEECGNVYSINPKERKAPVVIFKGEGWASNS